MLRTLSTREATWVQFFSVATITQHQHKYLCTQSVSSSSRTHLVIACRSQTPEAVMRLQIRANMDNVHF